MTWSDLARALEVYQVRDSKEGPLYGLFSSRDGRRKNESIESVTGIVLDFEHLDREQTERIVASLPPVAWHVDSSFRSRHHEPVDRSRVTEGGLYDKTFQGEVRFHVVIPFARPVSVAEYTRIWHAFASWFPELDPQCKNPSRIYYTPAHPPDVQPFYLGHDGPLLDPDSPWFADSKAVPVEPPVMPQAEGLNAISSPAFTRVIKKLARGTGPSAHAFDLLSRGLAFAEPGTRDVTLFHMVSELARELPQADPESIGRHFATSLSFMALQGEGAPTVEDVSYKFARALEHLQEGVQYVELKRSSSGSPVPCHENVRAVLCEDEEVKDLFRKNLFSGRVNMSRPPPWAPTLESHDMTDEDTTALACWLMRKYGLNVKPGIVLESIRYAARDRAFHPVRDYLQGLTWDGKPRLNSWLSEHLGCQASEYAAKVGAWWLMQAVSRVMRPGCQADYVLILEGTQGRGKSRALRALASDAWFSDDLAEVGDKTAAEKLQGKWIVEMAELSAVRKSRNEQMKAFLTRSVDRYREPYTRLAEDWPRQCVFAGSTNETEYLADTENRRYWPVKVSDSRIDFEGLKEVRDQLWAEAFARVQAGERAWPEGEIEALCAREVEKRREVDDFEAVVQVWLENPVGYKEGDLLTTRYFLERVAGLTSTRSLDSSRMNRTLGLLGFSRIAEGVRSWVPPASFSGAKPATVSHLRTA